MLLYPMSKSTLGSDLEVKVTFLFQLKKKCIENGNENGGKHKKQKKQKKKKKTKKKHTHTHSPPHTHPPPQNLHYITYPMF